MIFAWNAKKVYLFVDWWVMQAWWVDRGRINCHKSTIARDRIKVSPVVSYGARVNSMCTSIDERWGAIVIIQSRSDNFNIISSTNSQSIEQII